MAKPCSVCIHADADMIDARLIEGATLEALANAYGLSVTALHRHRTGHIPATLAKARDAREIAAPDSLMERVAALDARAGDIYQKAYKTNNLTAAVGAIRELRGITELYAKITGELSAQGVTNIIIAPEWVSLRNVILAALEPHPSARQAVIEALGKLE